MKSKFFTFLNVIFLLIAFRQAYAEIGDDNPTGIAGQFNGNVTTGCSYDPYTGNATRAITDIVVPGAVGTYPLAFTRTMNSRFYVSYPGIGGTDFGRGGGWRHSYQWGINRSVYSGAYPTVQPTYYIVAYPNGDLVTFTHQTGSTDPYFRSTIPGVRERFVPLDPNDPLNSCYLLLTDGGKVRFSGEDIETGGERGKGGGGDPEAWQTQIDYRPVEIIDPHGIITTVSGGFDSTGDFRVSRIQEQGGRSLVIGYVGSGASETIHTVTEYAAQDQSGNPTGPGRTVTYTCVSFGTSPAYTVLDNVDYWGDSSLTAHYAYVSSNQSPSVYPPLVATADDSMYAGPMKRISYSYSTNGQHGYLLSENSFDGTPVSTLSGTGNSRTETRGDGPSRTFTYSGGLLKSWTDFNGIPSSQDHVAGLVAYRIDERSNRTDFTHDSITGNVTSVLYPATSSDNGTRYEVTTAYDPNNPYYVASATNERSKETDYVRDPNTQEITDINYPEGLAHEGFHYNGFGQVDRHQRKESDAGAGYYEHLQYDDRGLLVKKWNPVASATQPTGNEPKISITYYPIGHVWQDRVQTVTDARGYPTTYEYERNASGTAVAGRGLVSKIIYPGDVYRSFAYDRVGNKVHEENELRQPMEYVYDEYSRLLQLKLPHPDPNNPAVQVLNVWDTTIYDYTPSSGNPLSLTANAPTTMTTAMNVVTKNVYDNNLRLWTSTRDPNGVAAKTEYHYDAAGNRDWVIDPNLHKTTTNYDARNRPDTVTSPPTDVAGVSGKMALVTQTFYDPAGNVRLIIQPDTQQQTKTYDALNRLQTDTRPVSAGHTRTTTYDYWPSGMLKSVLDPKQQLTQFEYNERDLKNKMIYPDLTTVVTGWIYDENGNMTQRPTVGGPKQLFTYDSRNRANAMRWDNAIDFSDFTYDAANRLRTATNPYSTVTRGYDVAGRLVSDEQALAGELNPAIMTVPPTSVVSRKTHPYVGDFDINLPLDGSTMGIESRSGGASNDYTLVLNFASPVTVTGARVSAGIGTVNTVNASGTQVTVNLTAVSNAQRLYVKVFGLNDGTNVGEVTVPMHVLVGDVNADGQVDVGDTVVTQNQSGQPITISNFRTDVNCDGRINIGDKLMVQNGAGAVTPAVQLPGPDVTISSGYDGDGRRNLLSASGTDYNFSFGYDHLGRFETISLNTIPAQGSPYYQYYYDPASNVTERYNWLNGSALIYLPDELNRVKELTLQARNSDSQGVEQAYAFSHEHYSYDQMSRVVWTDRDEDAKRDAFVYNYAGELTTASYGNGARVVNYGLDDAGNRDGTIDGLSYTPNSLNQYAQTSNGSEHEIVGFAGVTYQYLADTYLEWASSPSAGIRHFGYDALGRRVRRTLNDVSTYYTYDGAHPIIEYDGNHALVASSVYGIGVDEIIARYNNGLHQWLLQDRLGSTRAVVDSAGHVTEQYRYDAFGAPAIFSGPAVGTSVPPQNWLGTPTSGNVTQVNNRFLFTGREWASGYGFYEYRARAYNPYLGRFMSEDPLGFGGGDTNLFRYCLNDPVNSIDPSGLFDRKMFTDGVLNLGGGALMGTGIVLASPTGIGGVLAITFVGHAAVFTGGKGIAQIVQSFSSTPHGDPNALPTSLTDIGTKMAPDSEIAEGLKDSEEILEALYAGLNTYDAVEYIESLSNAHAIAMAVITVGKHAIPKETSGGGGFGGGFGGGGLGHGIDIGILGTTDTEGNPLFGSFFGLDGIVLVGSESTAYQALHPDEQH